MGKTKRLNNSFRTGTTIVEAAFILPLLLLLVLGAIEYGWLFFNVQQVTNAVRQGARIAILPHASAQTEAATAIQTLLTNARLWDDRSGDPTFTYAPIPGDPDGRRAVTVRVRISTAHLRILNMNAFSPTGTGLEPDTIGATVTMALEGT